MPFWKPLSIIAFGLLALHRTAAQAVEVIPFEYRDGLIWVKVTASGSKTPLNFVLDSGAGASVLSLQAARRMGAKLGHAETVRRVGNNATAQRVINFNATVSQIRVSSTPLALDLSDTSAECSRPIDGLLGQDFFQRRVIEISFKARRIRVLEDADSCHCCAVLPMKIDNDAMCVKASINGSASKWIRLDTGCDDGLHWVDHSSRGSEYVRTSVQLGDERIDHVKTALHKVPIFPSESGLLGNGILSNYLVTFDAINRRLLLEKS